MSRKQIEKKKKGRFRLSSLIILVLLVVIGVCLYNIIPYYYGNHKANSTYEELADDAVEVSTQDVENPSEDDWWYKDVSIDLAKMQKINSDCGAWLRFDHTDTICINYPVMTCNSTSDYLHNNIYKEYSFPGTLFLDPNNSKDFSDYSQIIYGHNMRNGSMFGTLKRLQDDDIFQKNHYFTLYTADMACRYQIFAYFTTEDGSKVYTTGFEADDIYAEYLEYLCKISDKKTEIQPEEDDHIVLLSTCTSASNQERFVVCGVCIAQHEYNEKN